MSPYGSSDAWSAEMGAVERKIADLTAERDEALAQVDKLVIAKTEVERQLGNLKHDFAGFILVVNSMRGKLEQLGVKLPPPTESRRHDVVIVMNAALAAADGKEYTPYDQVRELRGLARVVRSHVARGHDQLDELRVALDRVDGARG